MKKTKIFIGLFFAVFFIFLVARNINFSDFFAIIGRANWTYLVIAICLFFIGYACRIERWKLMLLHENPSVSWRECVGPLMGSVAANNVFPFRAGDVIRAFAFNRKLNVSGSTSLTTLVVERMLDLLMVVTFFGIGIVYFGVETSSLYDYGGGALVVAGLSIVLFLIFPSFFKPYVFGLANCLRFFSNKFANKVHSELEKIFLALRYTSNRGTMLKLVVWSLLAWLCEGLVFLFSAYAVPDITNAQAAFVALSSGTLATMIPSTPGYIGTFDYFVARTMSILGNSDESSVVFAFTVHMVLWLPPTIVGGVYLLRHPISKHRKL